jgi:hypothetical protein
MKFTIKTTELRKIMTGIRKVAGLKSSVPVLEHVKLQVVNGVLSLQATNLDEYITYTSNSATDTEDGNTLVAMNALTALAKGKGAVTIYTKDGQVFSDTELPDKVAALAYAHINHWPMFGTRTKKHKMSRVSWFLEAYQRAYPYASNDPLRAVLNCVRIEADNTVVATDGVKLLVQRYPNMSACGECMVPTRKFLAWVKPTDTDKCGFTSVVRDLPWFCVKSDNYTYYTRLAKGTYPAWKQVMVRKADTVRKLTLSDADVAVLASVTKTVRPIGALIESDGIPVLCTIDNECAKPDSHSYTYTPLTTSSFKSSVRSADGLITGFTINQLNIVLKTGFRTILLNECPRKPVLLESGDMTCVLMPARVENTPAGMPADAAVGAV